MRSDSFIICVLLHFTDIFYNTPLSFPYFVLLLWCDEFLKFFIKKLYFLLSTLSPQPHQWRMLSYSVLPIFLLRQPWMMKPLQPSSHLIWTNITRKMFTWKVFCIDTTGIFRTQVYTIFNLHFDLQFPMESSLLSLTLRFCFCLREFNITSGSTLVVN